MSAFQQLPPVQIRCWLYGARRREGKDTIRLSQRGIYDKQSFCGVLEMAQAKTQNLNAAQGDLILIWRTHSHSAPASCLCLITVPILRAIKNYVSIIGELT